MKKLVRNLSDPAARRFWEQTEQTAAVVRTWPAWKRGVTEAAPSESPSPASGQPRSDRSSRP